MVTVKLLNDLGIDIAFDYAEKMGITSRVKSGPVMDRNLASLALGGLTKGVSPIDMATAYGTLANKGVRIKPITYVRVTDANGNVLLEKEPVKTRVIGEDVAYIVTDMLESVVKGGTGTSANFNMPVAGKRVPPPIRWMHGLLATRPTTWRPSGWVTTNLQTWVLAAVLIPPGCGERSWKKSTRTCRL